MSYNKAMVRNFKSSGQKPASTFKTRTSRRYGQKTQLTPHSFVHTMYILLNSHGIKQKQILI